MVNASNIEIKLCSYITPFGACMQDNKRETEAVLMESVRLQTLLGSEKFRDY
jgi:hypothetical protein